MKGLEEGVYENLINKDLQDKIIYENEIGKVCKTIPIDKAESPSMLSEYLSQVIYNKLNDETLSTEERFKIVNNILKDAGVPEEEYLANSENYLSAVLCKEKAAELAITQKDLIRPLSGFRNSNLFTGGQSFLSLDSEINKDIVSADHICLIVSFLKLSGIRLLIDNLSKFCANNNHTLRIITTTYCGVTDAKAVQQLSELPNTEIKISYNTDIERLHAKSYIFIRNSGFHTAYIGSSNLSKSAHTDALEWNLRVTNIENPHIIRSAIATFEMYWNSPNFEDFRIGGIQKFYDETQKNQIRSRKTTVLQQYRLYPFQKAILDKLQAIREEAHSFHNLVVAATGTGKTVISAFDYQYFKRNNSHNNRLLFIAHRKEILEKSLQTYRGVLGDANFGELWVGEYKPEDDLTHLFVSVQTVNSKFEIFSKLPADYYDYIVIDEAHHMAANSYQQIINYFKPKILLGLTATPERMDGISLLPDFDNHISAEIRLPKALNEGLLTPFQYLCISDNTDLRDETLWAGGKYIKSKLADKLCDEGRLHIIYQALQRYIPDETTCKALCFCTNKKHADFMADGFKKLGLKAVSLTDETPRNERESLNHKLAEGEINYICTVDIYNEGVDIPEVDTVLFLRPTESLTIFLQQLGRGLRLSVGKSLLTVLDFVGQANRSYDFVSRFRALLTKPGTNVAEQIKKGFTLLPQGCYIHMEEKAQKYILENIQGAIYNVPRLIKELQSYSICPTLEDFLEANGQDIGLIYRDNHCWTSLKQKAGKCYYTPDANIKKFEKGMSNFLHINSFSYIRFIKRLIADNFKYEIKNNTDETFYLMFYYTLFQDPIQKTSFNSIVEALKCFAQYSLFVEELKEIIEYRIEHIETKTFSIGKGLPEALEQYGCYSREEIFIIFGQQTINKKMQGNVSGLFNFANINTEIFFVTLNKSDKDFSPTTQYQDYLINDQIFHWQSQNTDCHAKRGQRFVNQHSLGKKFILFVREDKYDGYRNTCPFYCLGLIDYIRSYGDFPMNIEWKLQEPALPQFIKAV